MTATTSDRTGMPGSARAELAQRYHAVLRRVADAAERSGRKPEDVVVVAVTKLAELDQVRELIGLGHRDFGENRVQQLVQRAPVVEEFLSRRRVLPTAAEQAPGRDAPDAVRWHLIGHLQRNKARKAVEFSRLIHSVDSLRLAEELQQIALRRDQPVDVLLQVNCSGESSKHGCALPAARHLAEQIDTMVYVRLRGVMTMAALDAPEAKLRSTFARCRDLFEEIRGAGIGEEGGAAAFNILSMGMSSDFEIAIEEGANMVRIGSAIFGEGVAQPEEESEDD